MLIAADELLVHQIGRPIAQTDITDHRFYDRYWFTGAAPDGALAFNMGMGLYKNTNVLDGYLAIQKDHKQFNVRFSRVLRPDIESSRVGPLSVSIVEPFKHLILRVDPNESGMSCELHWRSDYDVHLEAHHADMISGMITQEVSRYAQTGRVDGWIEVGGSRTLVENYWTVRDHSWGVRPGVGGFEPVRGDHSLSNPPHPRDQIRLWLWSCLSTKEYSLQVQRIEDSEGRLMHLDGGLLYKPHMGRAGLRVRDYEHDIRFVPGTWAVESLDYMITFSDGTKIDIKGEPLTRAWAYKGTGYDRGYCDGLGLGAQRGNPPPEFDIYDLSHPEVVRNMEGAFIGSGHREQPMRLTVNGEPCLGHFPVMVFDTLPGMSA